MIVGRGSGGLWVNGLGVYKKRKLWVYGEIERGL